MRQERHNERFVKYCNGWADSTPRIVPTLIIFPVSLLFAATHSMLKLLEVLKQGETSTPFATHMLTFAHFAHLIVLPVIQAIERHYGVTHSFY